MTHSEFDRKRERYYRTQRQHGGSIRAAFPIVSTLVVYATSELLELQPAYLRSFWTYLLVASAVYSALIWIVGQLAHRNIEPDFDVDFTFRQLKLVGTDFDPSSYCLKITRQDTRLHRWLFLAALGQVLLVLCYLLILVALNATGESRATAPMWMLVALSSGLTAVGCFLVIPTLWWLSRRPKPSLKKAYESGLILKPSIADDTDSPIAKSALSIR